MSTFRKWLEQQIDMDNMHLSSENDKMVKRIWDAMWKALIGGLDPKDEIGKSINDILPNRPPGQSASQALLNKISGPLQQLSGIPQYAGKVQDAKSWLGQDQSNNSIHKDKDMKELMDILFGDPGDPSDDKVQKLLNKEDISTAGDEGKLQKAPPRPPLDSANDMNLDMPDQPQPDPNDPNAAPMPQQPQVPPPNPMVQPTNPMPPIPPRAQMGLY
jgi:hypothetical protein